jgi:hypothetical protein
MYIFFAPLVKEAARSAVRIPPHASIASGKEVKPTQAAKPIICFDAGLLLGYNYVSLTHF